MPPRLTLGELGVRVDGMAVDTDRRFREADADRTEMRADIKDIAIGVAKINDRGRNTSTLVLIAVLSSFLFPLIVVILAKVFMP